MAQDRRSFLKTAGIAAAITSAAPLGLTMQSAAPGETARAAAAPRSFSAGHFALELDGETVGFLNSFTGGFPYGRVIEFRDGGDAFSNKTIGDVGFEDITIEASLGMQPAFWDWVTAMIAGAPQGRSGAITFLDEQNEAKNRLEFHDAWIAEVTFPAADAASKAEGLVTLVIAPGSTAYLPAGGKVAAPVAKQKKWLTSNFRLKVGDLPTARVSKVESLTIKQQISEASPGTQRTTIRVPGRLEYPNLSLALAAIDGQQWFDFFDDFVLQGNAQPSDELKGSLEFLAPDLQSALITLTFQHLGIFRCAPQKQDAGGDGISRIRAEMYVEQLALQVTP